MPITRRHVLALGAAIGAAGGVGVGALYSRWWDQPVGEGYVHLSLEEGAFLEAFAETAYPPGGTPAVSGGELGLSHFLDELAGAMEPTARTLIRALFHLMDDWPLPARGARFTDLDQAQRTEVFGVWMHHELSEIRNAFQSIVLLLGMGYTTHPRTVGWFRQLYACAYGA